jgi:hypothetical protein
MIMVSKIERSKSGLLAPTPFWRSLVDKRLVVVAASSKGSKRANRQAFEQLTHTLRTVKSVKSVQKKFLQ